MPDERSVVVVGAGLSGLTAAYRLQRAGVRVQVLEKAEAGPAGRALTTRRDGFLLDRGADALVDRYTEYFELAREVGLGDALFPITAPVGTVRDGRVITMTGSAGSFLRTELLSWRAKLRFFLGCARLYPTIRRVDTRALSQLADLDQGTAREVAERYFGVEATEYVIEPMTRMFNGSRAAVASAVEVAGGLALGTSATYALRGGVGALPEALAALVPVRHGTEVTEVRRDGDRVRVEARSSAHGPETITADGCVLATMLEGAAAIHRPLAEATEHLRAELEYIKLVKVQLAYAARTATDAFIVQSPPIGDDELMGMFLDHNKCPDRAPAGHSLLSVYADTPTSTRFLDRPDPELVDWARGRAEALFPELVGHFRFAEVTRWPFMGTSNKPGFYRSAGQALARLDTGSPVRAAGDWFTKSSQGAVVASGERAASDLLARFAARVSVPIGDGARGNASR